VILGGRQGTSWPRLRPAFVGSEALTRVGLLLACAVLGEQAVASPANAVYAVIVIGLVMLAAWNFVALLAVYTVLTFPARLPLGVGTATVAKPLGVLLVLSWLLYLGRNSDAPLLPRDHPLLTAVLSAFCAFAAASALWATAPGVSFSNAGRLLQMVLFFVVVYSAVRTQNDLFVIAAAYAFAGAVTATYALTNGATRLGRLTGGIGDPNFLAAEFAGAIVVAGFLLAATRRTSLRIALIASIAVDAAAFVLTQSRSGVFALAAALLVSVIVAGRLRPHAVVAVLVVVGLGVTYYAAIAAPGVRDRITNISAQGSSGRADEWKIAVQIFYGHPIAGGGLGNYPVLSPHYAAQNVSLSAARYALSGLVTHNTYLEILSELGLVGLALLLAFIGGIAALGFRALTGNYLADVRARPVGAGLVAALVGLLVAYFFLTGLYDKQLWLFFALAAALGNVGRTTMATGEPEIRFG